LPPLALAETSEVSPASFLVVLQQEIRAKPGEVYSDIGKVDKWWNKDHTWSGDAGNLSLQMTPGGCFCERWDSGAVVHGNVVGLRKDAQVRLQSSLGPLQDLAVTGILTFTMAPRGEGTLLKLTYRVNGGPNSGLDKWAKPVDGMLTDQLHRLASYAEKGTPE
jgi:hypothetical protein